MFSNSLVGKVYAHALPPLHLLQLLLSNFIGLAVCADLHFNLPVCRDLHVAAVGFRREVRTLAVVTGSSSGIGAQFCRQLASVGLNVVLTARRQDRLESLASELRESFPVQAKVVNADLASQDGWKSIVNACSDLEVGLLVNNAAFQLHGSFFRHSIDTYLDMISVNCSAVMALAHAFGRKMAGRGRGGIIFTSSIGRLPNPWWATYSSSKAFVTNMGIILRDELGRKGVTVMVLEPGLVKSELSDGVGKTISFRRLCWPTQPTDECVKEALQSFVKGRAKVTPGLFNNITYCILRLLPTALLVKLMSFAMSKAMDQTLTDY